MPKHSGNVVCFVGKYQVVNLKKPVRLIHKSRKARFRLPEKDKTELTNSI